MNPKDKSNNRNVENQKKKSITHCTLELLSHCSQLSYRVKDGKFDVKVKQSYLDTENALKSHGYEISKIVAPKSEKGEGKSSLLAISLKPTINSSAPIIISFRGTKNLTDVFSDATLSIAGVAGKKLRNAAFEFYKEVQIENPDREIVLTGHSLGGHLAQYVATKAYNTIPRLIDNPSLSVRTFNTAPISTTHSKVFKKNKDILRNFINYRVDSDIVSDLPIKHYYGSTFIFEHQKGSSAHGMQAVFNSLKDVASHVVGRSNGNSKEHNALVESVSGLQSSYACRIKGQFFSKYREGARNLAVMKEAFSNVKAHLAKEDYALVIEELTNLKEDLRNHKGKVSKNIIETLLKDANKLHKISLDNLLLETKAATKVAISSPAPSFFTVKSQQQEKKAPVQDQQNLLKYN